MAESNTPNPLDHLYSIVNDLWGSVEKDAAEIEALRSAARKQPAPAAGSEVPVPETASEPVPEVPSFEDFWYAVDETVDWTDALVYAASPSGLTDPVKWRFYHEKAERVLAGDLSAYDEVLAKEQPLSDLLPYAASFRVQPVSADRLSVTFEALPVYLEKPQAERRRYLAGIALRAARDLLALLPVTEVTVTATAYDQTALTMTLSRAQLQRVPFRFTDPVVFCESCGGTISL